MKRKICGILAAILLFANTQADAATLTYSFDLNNEGLIGGPWATITLTDTTYGTNGEHDAVKFQVDPIEGAFYDVHTNFGLETFYFNENTNQPASAIQISSVPDWEYIYSPNGSVGPFGNFELQYKGDGNSRKNPLEFYLYTTLFDLQAEQFAVTNERGYMFAGHIADFAVEGNSSLTSAQFASSGTPVPEPGTVTLFGLGLTGLAFYTRRRNRK